MSISETPPTVKLPMRVNPAHGTISDPILAILNAQLEEARKNPEKALEAVELHSTKKFVFRTKPNTIRNLELRIPGLPESERNKEEVGTRKHYGAEFARIYARKYSQDDLDAYEELTNRVGSPYISFTVVPQRHECYYETDDEMVADFIRNVIASGRQPYLYEDRGIQYIRSRYTDAIFPDTPDGKQQLYVHDLAYERAVRDIATRTDEAVLAAAETPASTPAPTLPAVPSPVPAATPQRNRRAAAKPAAGGRKTAPKVPARKG